MGIGLKTFVYRSSQYEKIAEFNKCQPEYKNLDNRKLVGYIAEALNERIRLAHRTYSLQDSVYHCVARKAGSFLVYETSMEEIDLNTITNIQPSLKGNTIGFLAGREKYRFNQSKSTLFKQFHPPEHNKCFEIPVNILEDPYQTVLHLLDRLPDDYSSKPETIILPLFSSTKTNNFVPEKSGLNQWNAKGRPRDLNEIYIPIPLWIHRSFPHFFPGRRTPFSLFLPDGAKLLVAICQDNGKALMSNPNKELGQWLLRRVLNLADGELLTYDKLLRIGIDSVAISKNIDGAYTIDFKATGTYEKFRQFHDL